MCTKVKTSDLGARMAGTMQQLQFSMKSAILQPNLKILPYENSVYDTVTTITEYFHMNWGWYGHNDGFYIEGAVAPSDNNFSVQREDMIIHKI